LEYQCSGVPFDPTRLHEYEGEIDPAKIEAIEKIEKTMDGARYAGNEWIEIGPTPPADEAHFVAEEDGAYSHIMVRRKGKGWRVGGWGDCYPPLIYAPDVNVAQWRLDPNFSPPGPEDTVVHALVTERECTSGADPTGRVREPQIVVEEERILVVLTVTPPEGGFYDCVGNPTIPFVISLPEPLGDRTLYDAAGYPPRPARRSAKDL
jgi:hypothetical protein